MNRQTNDKHIKWLHFFFPCIFKKKPQNQKLLSLNMQTYTICSNIKFPNHEFPHWKENLIKQKNIKQDLKFNLTNILNWPNRWKKKVKQNKTSPAVSNVEKNKKKRMKEKDLKMQQAILYHVKSVTYVKCCLNW